MLYMKKDNVKIYSIEMERFFNEDYFIARGNVEIIETNKRATGEMAVYTTTNRVLVLTGDPVLYRDGDIYKADRIELWLREDRLFLMGNVYAEVSEEK